MMSDLDPIYLDNMATTRLCDEAAAIMFDRLRVVGNASSRTHAYGWRAEAAVATGRRQVARLLGVRSSEVVFTSGATESNNTVIRGVVAANAGHAHIITSAVEHPSVLETCLHEQSSGRADVTVVPVDSDGIISVDAIVAAITPMTKLITVQAANNEVGTVQPIAEICAVARARGVFVHVDAAQAAGKIPLNARQLGVDAMSVSAHKIHGPQGIGALYYRAGALRLPPLLLGGGQEHGMRSGTHPVALIAAFGAACQAAYEHGADYAARVAAMRETLWEALSHRLDGVRRNASTGLPGCLNVTIDGIFAEALMAEVPQVAFSSTSACSSAQGTGSHVLTALGVSRDDQDRSVRFGIARDTSAADIATAAELLVGAVRRLRAGFLGSPSRHVA